MGGKNPLVVLDDCDLDRAVQCALDGAFFGTGQRCTASSRIIVTQNIHDKFVEALAARVKALKVGGALAADTQMGPLASQAQLDTTLSYVDVATQQGGRRVVGGETLSLATPGYYVAPALIADTRQDMRINMEEVFGPVASTVRVKDYDEALAVANAGEFGLIGRHHDELAQVCATSTCATSPPEWSRRTSPPGVAYHVPFGGTRKSSFRAARTSFRRGRVLHRSRLATPGPKAQTAVKTKTYDPSCLSFTRRKDRRHHRWRFRHRRVMVEGFARQKSRVFFLDVADGAIEALVARGWAGF
jgi:aldehyde dehydrogenase (NAD+)